MDRRPLVLLLGADPLTGLLVDSSLQTYGFDVALASTDTEALDQLQSRRVGALVADMDAADASKRLAFIRAARRADPSLTVIYTARMPSKLSEGEKVAGAPCLRTPYHPFQIVSLIRQLGGRHATAEAATHAA